MMNKFKIESQKHSILDNHMCMDKSLDRPLLMVPCIEGTILTLNISFNIQKQKKTPKFPNDTYFYLVI